MDLYVDLGTANTLIYGKGRGFLLNEPSVVAFRHRPAGGTPEIFSLGKAAKAMLGKNPEHITVERPLREGVIADFESTTKMLWALTKRIKENTFWLRPRMIISLPCQVTEFEKSAVKDVGHSLGARTVHLLDEPVAAAIGAGLPVMGHDSRMVVDIGGGTTEIAVLSLGGIISSTAIRIGGNSIDAAIIHTLRDKFNFVIGEQTAERIKLEVGQARPMIEHDLSTEAGGIDLRSGLPKKIKVTSSMIAPAVDSVINQILESVRKTLSELPPEVSSDIIDSGITMAGGGALIRNIPNVFQQEFSVHVQVAAEPMLSVAMGGARALENNQLFDSIEKPA